MPAQTTTRLAQTCRWATPSRYVAIAQHTALMPKLPHGVPRRDLLNEAIPSAPLPRVTLTPSQQAQATASQPPSALHLSLPSPPPPSQQAQPTRPRKALLQGRNDPACRVGARATAPYAVPEVSSMGLTVMRTAQIESWETLLRRTSSLCAAGRGTPCATSNLIRTSNLFAVTVSGPRGVAMSSTRRL